MDDQTLALLLFKMTAFLIAGTAVAATLRRSSAGARHLVWLTTLAGLFVLPAALRYAPLQLPILPRFTLAAPEVASTSTSGSLPGHDRARRVEGSSLATQPATPGPTVTSSAWRLTVTLQQGLLALWGAGAALLLAYFGTGVLSVRRIIRFAQPLETAPWTGLLAEVADRLDLAELPGLLASDRTSVPFAYGPWRPTVVLPSGAHEWTEERRALVLSHELAHLKRHDLLSHAIGRAACAFYWFHPLVWTAARHLRAESERACDDLVLRNGVRPSDYADHLLDILTTVRRDTVPGAAVAMARRKEFEGRVLAILDPGMHRGSPRPMQAAALLGCLGAVFVAVAASAPSHAETASPVPAPAAVAVETVASRPEAVIADKREREHQARHAHDYGVDVNDRHDPLSPDRRATLVRVLRTDSEASVRRTAAWALAGSPEADATEALAGALHGDASAEVRETAAWALGSGDEGGAAVLGEALRKDNSPEVRATAAWALGQRRVDDLSPLLAALSDTRPEVREVAIWGVGSQRVAKAPEAVVAALRDADNRVRLVAAWALGQIGDKASIVPLKTAFKEENDDEVRRAFFHALYLIGERSPEVADWAFASKDAELRQIGVQMLAAHRSGPWPWPWPRPEPRPFP